MKFTRNEYYDLLETADQIGAVGLVEYLIRKRPVDCYSVVVDWGSYDWPKVIIRESKDDRDPWYLFLTSIDND